MNKVVFSTLGVVFLLLCSWTGSIVSLNIPKIKRKKFYSAGRDALTYDAVIGVWIGIGRNTFLEHLVAWELFDLVLMSGFYQPEYIIACAPRPVSLPTYKK